MAILAGLPSALSAFPSATISELASAVDESLTSGAHEVSVAMRTDKRLCCLAPPVILQCSPKRSCIEFEGDEHAGVAVSVVYQAAYLTS